MKSRFSIEELEKMAQDEWENGKITYPRDHLILYLAVINLKEDLEIKNEDSLVRLAYKIGQTVEIPIGFRYGNGFQDKIAFFKDTEEGYRKRLKRWQCLGLLKEITPTDLTCDLNFHKIEEINQKAKELIKQQLGVEKRKKVDF